MKPKVLILYNKLFHYRIPVWNILSNKCDLTVAYSLGKENIPQDIRCNFIVLHLPVKKYKRITIQKQNIKRLVKDYDAVIVYGDILWLKYSTLPWRCNTPVVFHTLGVSASYGKHYDEKKKWDAVRAFFYKKADALAFYTDYPISKYESYGIPKERMFVAHNTVAVYPLDIPASKDTILMIGTLYRQKGVQLLLEVYKRLRGKCTLPLLNIIGNGPDFNNIKSWIDNNNMEDYIKLRGAVYEISTKAEYFSRALACISPKQAGLTVLESMGYGVPFVTTKNAITGGEIFNIHNGVDGVIMDNESELESVILDIATNPDKYLEMGKKAQVFYNANRTPEIMAAGLWDAVSYAIREKRNYTTL